MTVTAKLRIMKTFPVLEGVESWRKENTELIDAIRAPDVEVEFWDLPDATIKKIARSYDADAVSWLHIQLAERAEREGFDALALGCVLEPGVDGAKEAVSIPVVGACEGALYMACMAGRRFSFILPSNGGWRGYRDLVTKYGLGGRLASFRGVEASPLQFAAQEDWLKEAMLEQAEKAVREDGASVVISYGGLDVITFLRAKLSVPVVSPVQAQVALATTLARLRLSHSRVDFPHQRV